MKSRPVQIIGWVFVAALAILFLRGQVVPLLDDAGTGVPAIRSHANDFKHIWLGARLLAAEVSPYDTDTMLMMAGAASFEEDPRFRTILPYVYLPFTGLAMRPVTALPFATSVAVFQVMNHVLLIASLVLVVWASGLWRWMGAWSLVLALLLVSFNAALFRQNNAGQLNVVLLFCWALVYTASVRRWNPGVSGGVAAFGALFKLSPGVLVFWYLLRRRWIEFGWMAGVGLLLLVSTVATYGIRPHLDFIPVLRDMGYGRSTWPEHHTFWRDAYNQSFNALFHRALVRVDGGVDPLIRGTASLANGLTWLCSLVILGLMGFACLRDKTPGGAASWSAVLAASLLLPSICWDHYLVQLIPAILVLFALAWLASDGQPRRGLTSGRIVLTILLGLAAVLISIPIRFHEFGGGGIEHLLGSAKLPATLLTFGVGVWLATRGNLDDDQVLNSTSARAPSEAASSSSPSS